MVYIALVSITSVRLIPGAIVGRFYGFFFPLRGFTIPRFPRVRSIMRENEIINLLLNYSSSFFVRYAQTFLLRLESYTPKEWVMVACSRILEKVRTYMINRIGCSNRLST